MFERKAEQLLPTRKFIGRLFCLLSMAFALVVIALLIGILGYHYIAGLSWIDSLLNASMILTGMGPVSPMATSASKLFASAYALFSGLVVLTTVGLVLAPVFHRVLHTFHLESDDDDGDSRSPRR